MEKRIKADCSWLGEITDYISVREYVIVEYKDKESFEKRYTGYLIKEDDSFRRDCVSYPTFEMCILGLIAKKNGEDLRAAGYAGKILGL